MPFMNVKIAGPTLALEQIERLQRGLTVIMCETLYKRRELTSVLIEQMPPGRWSIAGNLPSVSAHATATVSACTNTSDEKARFIAEAHQLLSLILGGWLPLPTYVVIVELRDDSWGYDGITHQHRARSEHSCIV